jgi:hypothetical protein
LSSDLQLPLPRFGNLNFNFNLKTPSTNILKHTNKMLSTLAATAVLFSSLSLVNGQTFTDCNPTAKSTLTLTLTLIPNKCTANIIQLALRTRDMAKATPSSPTSQRALPTIGR